MQLGRHALRFLWRSVFSTTYASELGKNAGRGLCEKLQKLLTSVTHRERLELNPVKLSLFAISLACLLCLSANAQYHSRRGTAATSGPQPIKGVVVTLHGSVKKLTKNEILIQSDEDELVTLRCSKKTKFSDADGEIKRTAIDLESKVTVDASEDNDLKLMALTVKVDAANKKTLEK